jgi:inner membrane protein
MPSPIGHTLAGLSGYLLLRYQVSQPKRIWLCLSSIAIANLPDIDFLPGLLQGQPWLYHRQATHSFCLALLFSWLLTWWAKPTGLPRRLIRLWSAGLYCSHIVLDLLVIDRKPPAGVQALWPFSNNYVLAPISFIPGLQAQSPVWNGQNLWAVSCEILLLLPIVWLIDHVVEQPAPD